MKMFQRNQGTQSFPAAPRVREVEDLQFATSGQLRQPLIGDRGEAKAEVAEVGKRRQGRQPGVADLASLDQDRFELVVARQRLQVLVGDLPTAHDLPHYALF